MFVRCLTLATEQFSIKVGWLLTIALTKKNTPTIKMIKTTTSVLGLGKDIVTTFTSTQIPQSITVYPALYQFVRVNSYWLLTTT